MTVRYSPPFLIPNHGFTQIVTAVCGAGEVVTGVTYGRLGSDMSIGGSQPLDNGSAPTGPDGWQVAVSQHREHLEGDAVDHLLRHRQSAGTHGRHGGHRLDRTERTDRLTIYAKVFSRQNATLARSRSSSGCTARARSAASSPSAYAPVQ